MTQNALKHYKTIGEFHHARGLPQPEHPLISVINVADLRDYYQPVNMVQEYYSISLKRNFKGRFLYGQSDYDFEAGLMYFIAPGQVFKIEHPQSEQAPQQGWLLLFHPMLLRNTPLLRNMGKYEFFLYAVNEALFLSPEEERIIHNLLENIKQEYTSSADNMSRDIIIPQLEALLNYAERFYQRQFATRKKSNHRVLDQFEQLLSGYFEGAVQNGLPTVHLLSDGLNISPGYLSSLLKSLTGQSAQQHIYGKVLSKAKEKLSATALSVSEIAYALGFEHPQSFSKFFKGKTGFTPGAFRQSFN